jgi:hypothetical protein
MEFNNEYLINFDDKYTFENFNIKNPLPFFLGKPNKYEIKIKNVCASCELIKDDKGVFITKFNTNEKTIKGRRLEKLLKKPIQIVSLYRNIIKKSNFYHLSSVFINVEILSDEENSIISKKQKLDEIMLM